MFEALVPLRVGVGFEKTQVESAGRLKHVSEICWLNELSGLAMIV